MPTWYIVAGPTGGVNKVYAHHGVDGGSPGCWARDFDAEYAPALFGYTRCSRAKATAQRLVDTGRGDPQSPHIFVVPRERLFELLEVKDWSNMGWQPIETAPRDGTYVDVWDTSNGRTTDVKWDHGAWKEWTFGFESPGFVEIDPQPTHWMPRPAPPSEA